ncbi:hypothetical protein BH11ARM1_BH11ARM1_17790 [soil metagenome]
MMPEKTEGVYGENLPAGEGTAEPGIREDVTKDAEKELPADIEKAKEDERDDSKE